MSSVPLNAKTPHGGGHSSPGSRDSSITPSTRSTRVAKKRRRATQGSQRTTTQGSQRVAVEEGTQAEKTKKKKSIRRRNTTKTANNKSVADEEGTQIEKSKKKTIRRRDTIKTANNKSVAEEEGTQIEKTKKKSIRRRATAKTNKTEDEQAALKSVLRQFALDTVSKGIQGILNEFGDIKATTSAPPVKTAFDAHPDKNRYKDVICAEASRVILHWPPNSQNDYINANYVAVRSDPQRMICTQGPMERTTEDFWRMIWQTKCKAIVMLCSVMENGKKKCEQYWPEKPGDSMTTQTNITIRNNGISEAEKMLCITTLEVTAEGESFTIEHMQWIGWPDKGVPHNIMASLRLLARLKHFSPIVVHCSAGIGRTGTIVALELAMQTIYAGEPLCMSSIVKELRSYRHGAVQTDIQYVYMHRVMMGLAENKKTVKPEEIKPFYEGYEAFLKSRGC